LVQNSLANRNNDQNKVGNANQGNIGGNNQPVSYTSANIFGATKNASSSDANFSLNQGSDMGNNQ